MPGTILENLSGRKLSVLVAILFFSQLGCFLVGLIAPKPANSQGILATVCHNNKTAAKDMNYWVTRNCERIDLNHVEPGLTADDIVFVLQMPLSPEMDFSRWQQNLVGILQFDLLYQKGLNPVDFIVELTIDARLAFSDKKRTGGRTPWTYYAHSEEKRYMDCNIDLKNIKDPEGYPYNCSMVPLFELGSLYHDYYLLNIRLPYNEQQMKNVDLRKIQDVYLHLIHMNGGFTQVWVSLKTFFFPIIIGIMVWFWRRVHLLSRTPALLEYMLISLGGTLAFLDLPLEYLTLWFEMPYMLLLSDIRQGIFYAMLLSFWLVFAGEHMLIQDNGEKNSIKLYWKHLSTIVTGCLSLLVFDLCERGIQLVNPFYSIWVTPVGTNLALSFIILAGISASMYFIFLCYMIWRVFKNISIKRSVLPSMSQARRLHYEGIIYRFNFLMLATVICAAVTVISFILSQVAEGQNKWDENMELELSSALHTGVYGMWNVYICAMLMLYAPSHKQWPAEPICTEGEEVEFSRLPTDPTPNEISSLTSFASKASIE
ncbi:Protein wntless-like Protein [Tribolium castaneum]|uniref:Protein wntless n=1 Tax=Tribolium castaneum TaxID=7070 RepID=D6WUV8_TRICA|nr:PREDICTED: protein wntless [Tribolium castaneum]EFA07787.1 Protein wntless-like Protein [Tribolium castaneum]|eukprot:XP_974084.1 PREDICTED: protein wntless [Tribolium castaneum]